MNRKDFARFFFSQITAINAKSTYSFPAVDLSWTVPAFPVGSSAAQRCCQLLKMAVVLHTSTAYEQQSVIRFLWSEGWTPIEIHRQMQPTCRKRCRFEKCEVVVVWLHNRPWSLVWQWAFGEPDEFYHSGISNLVLRWDKCLDRCGDFVIK